MQQQQTMFVYNQNFLFIFAWPNHKKSNISPKQKSVIRPE